MPRSKHEFIKIEMRLFNDPRFLELDDFEKLTYIHLIALAKQTKNKITKKLPLIKVYLRSERKASEIKVTVERIKRIFPNFRSNKHFYYFTSYDERYAYGTPKGNGDMGVDEEKEKEKEKDEEDSSSYSNIHKEKQKWAMLYSALEAYKQEAGSWREAKHLAETAEKWSEWEIDKAIQALKNKGK